MVPETDGSGNGDGGKKKRPQPVIKQITVKVIERGKRTSLVEWLDVDGGLCRVTVPNGKIKDGQCGENTLNAGIPYGEAWEALDMPLFDTAAFARELRREGIWTREDFLARLHKARAAASRSNLNPLINNLVQEFLGGK